MLTLSVMNHALSSLIKKKGMMLCKLIHFGGCISANASYIDLISCTGVTRRGGCYLMHKVQSCRWLPLRIMQLMRLTGRMPPAQWATMQHLGLSFQGDVAHWSCTHTSMQWFCNLWTKVTVHQHSIVMILIPLLSPTVVLFEIDHARACLRQLGALKAFHSH